MYSYEKDDQKIGIDEFRSVINSDCSLPVITFAKHSELGERQVFGNQTTVIGSKPFVEQTSEKTLSCSKVPVLPQEVLYTKDSSATESHVSFQEYSAEISSPPAPSIEASASLSTHHQPVNHQSSFEFPYEVKLSSATSAVVSLPSVQSASFLHCPLHHHHHISSLSSSHVALSSTSHTAPSTSPTPVPLVPGNFFQRDYPSSGYCHQYYNDKPNFCVKDSSLINCYRTAITPPLLQNPQDCSSHFCPTHFLPFCPQSDVSFQTHGNDQDSINTTSFSQTHPHPVHFYPIFLCKTSSGGLEAVNFLPHHPHHHQEYHINPKKHQDNISDQSIFLADNSCPIHGGHGFSSCVQVSSGAESAIYSSQQQQQHHPHVQSSLLLTSLSNNIEPNPQELSQLPSSLLPVDRGDVTMSSCDLDRNHGEGAAPLNVVCVQSATTLISNELVSLAIQDGCASSAKAYSKSQTPPERDVPFINMQDSHDQTEAESEDVSKRESKSMKKLKNSRDTGGMAFTIDFGNDGDKPEITENWKKLVPSKVHTGIQERQEEQKRRRQSKEAAELKKNEKMTKSRSHSGYMSEGHDASSILSTDEDASTCSDLHFRCDKKFSSPKRFSLSEKQSSARFRTPTSKNIKAVIPIKKIVKSAPPMKNVEKSTSGFHKRKINPVGSGPKAGDGSFVTKKSDLVRIPFQRRGEDTEKSFDAEVEGTAYLIKKMLNDITSTSNTSNVKNLGSPGIARRLKMGMKQARADEDNEDDAVVEARPPSESGTYTIDEEEDDDGETNKNAGEVMKARRKIDETFGVVYKLPVIDDVKAEKRLPRPKKTFPPDRTKISEELRSPKAVSGKTTVTVGASKQFPAEEDDGTKLDNRINSPECQIEREDSFERLMNETSSRLNALIDATSRVIRDAKISTTGEHAAQQLSSSLHRTTTHAVSKESLEENGRRFIVEDSGFFVVSCDTPATRKTRSISSCEAGSTGLSSPPPSDIRVSKQSVSEVEAAGVVPYTVLKTPVTSFASRRGKSAEVRSSSKREMHKFRDVLNTTPTSTGNLERKTTKKFVAPFAKSLSNVNNTPSSTREGTTFIRDVALIRDMVENVSGTGCRIGPERTRSAFTRNLSTTSSSPSVAQATTMRTNRTFALRCSKAAPTGAAEVPCASAFSPRFSARSRSVGNSESGRIKSRESSRTRLSSQQTSQSTIGSSTSPIGDVQLKSDGKTRRMSGGTGHDSSAFIRKDGGRYSMRVEKPIHSAKQGDTNQGGDAPVNAWQRRKNYDPRKSVGLPRSRSSSTKRIDKDSDAKGLKDATHASKNIAVSSKISSTVPPGKKLSKIAQMSHAVANNLNALARNSDLEVPVSLKRLPVFTHDSPSSAFTSCTTSAKQRSLGSNEGNEISPTDSSPYDSVLVDSIQQVSKKVKSLADVLIGRMRDDSTFDYDEEEEILGKKSTSNASGPAPIWQSANPELAAILENLKRTELHLQEVHKTLFSDPVELLASSSGPLPNSPHLARKAGFIPIDRPHAVPCDVSHDDDDDEDDEDDEDECYPSPSLQKSYATETSTKSTLAKKANRGKTYGSPLAMSAGRKKAPALQPTNHNPLSGDEYY